MQSSGGIVALNIRRTVRAFARSVQHFQRRNDQSVRGVLFTLTPPPDDDQICDAWNCQTNGDDQNCPHELGTEQLDAPMLLQSSTGIVALHQSHPNVTIKPSDVKPNLVNDGQTNAPVCRANV